MPKKYTVSVRRFVLTRFFKMRMSIAQIVAFSGISRSTIWRWTRYGIEDKPVVRKAPTLKDRALPFVIEHYNERCYATQADIRAMLASHEIKCCLKSVFRLLKQAGISRKRMKRKRGSKNCTPSSKANYKTKLFSVLDDGEDVLFQDESHFSSAVLPLYGYSKKGVPCYVNEPAERKAHTLIFAFSKSGQFFYRVYEGAMNTARMQWFVDALPPIRIVMDNLSIHKGIRTDAEKIFTPVAQPYANPAEIIFSKVKQAYRILNADNPDIDVSTKIDMAIETLTDSDLDGAISRVREFVTEHY